MAPILGKLHHVYGRILGIAGPVIGHHGKAGGTTAADAADVGAVIQVAPAVIPLNKQRNRIPLHTGNIHLLGSAVLEGIIQQEIPGLGCDIEVFDEPIRIIRPAQAVFGHKGIDETIGRGIGRRGLHRLRIVAFGGGGSGSLSIGAANTGPNQADKYQQQDQNGHQHADLDQNADGKRIYFSFLCHKVPPFCFL